MNSFLRELLRSVGKVIVRLYFSNSYVGMDSKILSVFSDNRYLAERGVIIYTFLFVRTCQYGERGVKDFCIDVHQEFSNVHLCPCTLHRHHITWFLRDA